MRSMRKKMHTVKQEIKVEDVVLRSISSDLNYGEIVKHIEHPMYHFTSGYVLHIIKRQIATAIHHHIIKSTFMCL